MIVRHRIRAALVHLHVTEEALGAHQEALHPDVAGAVLRHADALARAILRKRRVCVVRLPERHARSR